VAPGTRLRRKPAPAGGHLLELARGEIAARVSAPPRLLAVETPAATAVDLGCAYTLRVAAGGGGSLTRRPGRVGLQGGAGAGGVGGGGRRGSPPRRGPGGARGPCRSGTTRPRPCGAPAISTPTCSPPWTPRALPMSCLCGTSCRAPPLRRAPASSIACW